MKIRGWDEKVAETGFTLCLSGLDLGESQCL